MFSNALPPPPSFSLSLSASLPISFTCCTHIVSLAWPRVHTQSRLFAILYGTMFHAVRPLPTRRPPRTAVRGSLATEANSEAGSRQSSSSSRATGVQNASRVGTRATAGGTQSRERKIGSAPREQTGIEDRETLCGSSRSPRACSVYTVLCVLSSVYIYLSTYLPIYIYI